MNCSAQLNTILSFCISGKIGSEDLVFGWAVRSHVREDVGTEKVVGCHWQKRP